MKDQKHLPIFGVGPLYGAGVILATLLGVLLSAVHGLDSGLLLHPWSVRLSLVLGVLFLLLGAAVWAPAALGSHCIDRYIRKNELCVTGIYRFVRNPCYSGIALACTGVLLLAHNLWLLLLPPLFWLFLTVLMKHTEEKWLYDLYGTQYRDYCRRVNRCIPWFPRKNS